VLLGHVLRERWQEAHLREATVLRTKVPAAPPPAMPPRPMVQKLQPASYVEVSEKVLFSKDRNNEVIPEPPKPPPPPPPVPPFPVAHGVMIWGDLPPMIILSVGKGEQLSYRAGDKVGEFEIASINDRQIVFTWNGKTFVKNIAELEAADTAPAAAPGTRQAMNAPPEGAAPPPPAAVVQGGPAAGQNISQDGKTKTCDQNAPSPIGSIVDGYRKVAAVSPMAPNAHFCRWESVN